MSEPIIPRTHILCIYRRARRSLDPMASVEHVARVTGQTVETVQSVIDEEAATA